MKLKATNSAPKLEKDIQKDAMDWLKANGFSADVITKGLYGGNGIADIIACKDGQYYAIEVKRPGCKPTPLQRQWLTEKAMHGAVVVVVSSIKQLNETGVINGNSQS